VNKLVQPRLRFCGRCRNLELTITIDSSLVIFSCIMYVPRGVHPHYAMMHFPPFQIFPISEKISDSIENFPNFTFSGKFLDFPQKFLMTFFGHSLQTLNVPIFSLFQYISPIFRKKILFPPYFCKTSP